MKHYSKNDILDLQLKYKHDDTVLDLVAAVDAAQDNQSVVEILQKVRNRIDDIDTEVSRTMNIIDQHMKEVKK
jgi:hypothetical protein